MRVLAIDLGDRRTGLALGDTVTRIATPAGVIEVARTEADGEALLAAVAGVVARELGPVRRGWGASGGASSGLVVFGLPLNMDGSEGPASVKVRAFAAEIAARTGHAVEFQDERLSTVQADWTMARSGMTRGQKKARRDALAAAEILSRYLNRDEAGGTASDEAEDGGDDGVRGE